MSTKTNWLFEERETPQEAQALPEELLIVSKIYDNLSEHYTKKRTFFVPPKLKDKKKLQEKQTQLLRLLARCQELGAPVELYLRAQFEELAYVLNRVGIARPPMSMILSSAGVTRYNKYLDRIEQSFIDKEDKLRQSISPLGVDRVKACIDSAMTFAKRLSLVQKHTVLDSDVAAKELEMAVRIGIISPYYVMVSPVVDVSNSMFLQTIKAAVGRRLNKEQIRVMQMTHETLAVNENLVHYV